MNGLANEFIKDMGYFFGMILSPDIQVKLIIIKILFVLFSIVFLVLIIYYARRSSYLQHLIFEERRDWADWKDYGKNIYLKQWEAIKKRVEKNSLAENKLALVESVKMLNEVLEKLGYVEEKLTDKLSHFNKESLSTLEDVKNILNIYQDIAQDPNYNLNKETVQEYLEVFEKSFKELEVL
jgi:hypothetical protein